jgi:hypothetical protein
MIKRLLIGAVLGVIGKKMYDEGRLDPYIAKAKDKLGGQVSKTEGPPAASGAAGSTIL